MSALVAELHPFSLRLTDPLTTAHGRIEARDGVLLSLTDGRHTGWGEASPMPGWSVETLADSTDVLVSTVAALTAVRGTDDPRLGEMLDELERWPHARAAIAGAILDLTARQHRLGVAAMLSSDAVAEIMVNGLVADSTPASVAASAAALASEGMGTIKIKVAFLDPATDLARVAAAREAVGAETQIRLDANGGWDVETAVTVLAGMSAYDVSFCEEPTTGIAGIAAVGAASAIPVAVDESARSVDDIATALGTGTIDVIVVKPQAIGGPDLAVRAIRLVQEFGGTAVVTSMIDSAIGLSHAVHVAAASGSRLAHGLHTSSVFAEDLAPVPEVSRGVLRVPSGPGLGVVPRFAGEAASP